MMRGSRRGRKPKSIKDSGGLSKPTGIHKAANLGILMRKYRTVEDVLYEYTANMDFVFEDMDFTIEDFSDMTGADLEELMDALNRAIKL